MKTETISLVCVTSDQPRLRSAAHQLAVTGLPIVGRSSTVAPRFIGDNSLIVLMAVTESNKTPLGVVAWELPGPSTRIPSASVLAMAVDRRLPAESYNDVVAVLSRGVAIQFEYILGRLPKISRSSGYVVADLPQTEIDYGKIFIASGWLGLQSSPNAKTVRYVAFVDAAPVPPSLDDDYDLVPEGET